MQAPWKDSQGRLLSRCCLVISVTAGHEKQDEVFCFIFSVCGSKRLWFWSRAKALNNLCMYQKESSHFKLRLMPLLLLQWTVKFRDVLHAQSWVSCPYSLIAVDQLGGRRKNFWVPASYCPAEQRWSKSAPFDQLIIHTHARVHTPL